MKGEKRQQQTQKHFFQLSYFNLVSEQAIPDYPYRSILSREGTAPFSCNVYKNTDFFFFLLQRRSQRKGMIFLPNKFKFLNKQFKCIRYFLKIYIMEAIGKRHLKY